MYNNKQINDTPITESNFGSLSLTSKTAISTRVSELIGGSPLSVATTEKRKKSNVSRSNSRAVCMTPVVRPIFKNFDDGLSVSEYSISPFNPASRSRAKTDTTVVPICMITIVYLCFFLTDIHFRKHFYLKFKYSIIFRNSEN